MRAKLAEFAAAATFLALLCLPATAGAQDAAKDHGPIAWKDSLDEAKKIAVKEKKIILMDFWAPWCGPCKQMLKTTYQDKDVVERSKKFVPLLVNFDKQPDLVKKYQIGTIPQVFFLDAAGKVLKKTEPKYLDAKALLKIMDEVSKKSKG
jgi:thiol:disulfide interchange protein